MADDTKQQPRSAFLKQIFGAATKFLTPGVTIASEYLNKGKDDGAGQESVDALKQAAEDSKAAAADKKARDEKKAAERAERAKTDPLLNMSESAKETARQIATNPELKDLAIPAQNAARDAAVRKMSAPEVIAEQGKVAAGKPSNLDPVTPKQAIEEVTGMDLSQPIATETTDQATGTVPEKQATTKPAEPAESTKKDGKFWGMVKGYMSTRLGRKVTDDEAKAFVANGFATGIQNAGATLSGSGNFAQGDFERQVQGQNEAQAMRRTNEAELEKYGAQLNLSKDQQIELQQALANMDVRKARELQTALAEGRVSDIKRFMKELPVSQQLQIMLVNQILPQSAAGGGSGITEARNNTMALTNMIGTIANIAK